MQRNGVPVTLMVSFNHHEKAERAKVQRDLSPLLVYDDNNVSFFFSHATRLFVITPIDIIISSRGGGGGVKRLESNLITMYNSAD